jgi:hypothetical protein
VIGEALAAKGGKAKLAAIKSLREKATGNIQGTPVEVERVYVAPDKLHIEAVIGGKAKVDVGVNGKTAWQSVTKPGATTPETHDFPPEELPSAQFELWRDPELLLLEAAKSANVTPAPDESIDGKPQSVVRVESPFQGLDITLYIDKKTKLLTRVHYVDHGQPVNDDFADYRDVNGIKVAYKRNTVSGGKPTSLDIQKVEIDPKIDPAIFAKPK